MSHWHTVLVESEDTGEAVEVGAYLSPRFPTRDAAADNVAQHMHELSDLDEAAILSAREALITDQESVRLNSWSHAFRELRLTECGERPCAETVIVFGDALRKRVEALTGRPVRKAPIPLVLQGPLAL